MSPTSISGGGKLQTGGELISPASCDAKLVPVGKHQEEDLSSTNLEQRPYKRDSPWCKHQGLSEVVRSYIYLKSVPQVTFYG